MDEKVPLPRAQSEEPESVTQENHPKLHRPAVPAEVETQVLIEAGHKCAVCGEPAPLELAHIIPWRKVRNHSADNIICLCANCHSRADKEKWSVRQLKAYKESPWVARQSISPLGLARTKKIAVTIDMEIKDFDEKNKRILQYSLAGFLELAPESIKIISIQEGSTKITLEVPRRDADTLVRSFQTQDPKLLQALGPLSGLVVAAWPPGPPAQPRFVVRVGVTGHRFERLPKEDYERLRVCIRQSLEKLRAIVYKIFAESNRTEAGLYSEADPLFRLISPLAEGSDRLVAEEALALGYELQCPLPFPREEYELDFKTEESKITFRCLLGKASTVLELDGKREAEAEAYEAVGRLVLRQCDILIAVWDGKAERGLGGTAQIVRESLSFEIPTVWVQANSRPKASLLLSLEPQQELAEYSDTLSERLRSMFMLTIKGRSKKDTTERIARENNAGRRFFVSGIRRWHFGSIFKLFRELWSLRIGKAEMPDKSTYLGEEHDLSSWRRLFESNPQFRRSIGQNYAWSDQLANYYGNLYRSSFILTFSMGSAAVLLAFIGFTTTARPEHYLWYAAELALILVISALTWFGRRSGWHARWMDYRLLAESLRQIRFLAPLGRVTPSFKVPAHIQPSDPRNTWSNWFFRALVREGGMLAVRFDYNHLKLCRASILAAASEQIEYHKSNHLKLEIVSKRLHFVAQGLFGLAALACALHFTPEHWLPRSVSLALGLATIVLPAFGASLSAISHQGEFERLAIRSKALEERLAKLVAKEVPPESSLSSKDLGRAAEAFSDIMVGELLDWRFAFLEKNLELPA